MRWIIKRGPAKLHPEPLYWVGPGLMIAWNAKRVNAAGFKTKAAAKTAIRRHKLHLENAGPVRVLSAEEAKRKFAAGVIGRTAVNIRHVIAISGQAAAEAYLRTLADKLWPVKGKR